MSTAQYAAMTREQALAFMPDRPPQLARKRLAELVDGRSVVDIGCGRGEEVELYAPDKYQGFDCSAELVALARELHPGYCFDVLAAQEITFGIELAIMKAVLEHLPPAEALSVYNHVRAHVGTLYLCWHWEPSRHPKLTTYPGELGTMQQNRHDVADFHGIAAREVVGNHVIWTVRGNHPGWSR